MPVPGDGRYEWNGCLPILELPHVLNPPAGYIATANNNLFPPHYEFADAVHYTWADPFRAARISEVLGSGALATVSSMVALQNDVTSLPARSLVPLLRDLPIDDGATARARDMLVTWNDALDPDSVAAGVYEMWMRRLLPNLRDRLVPEAARSIFPSLSLTRSIDWLEAPDGRFGPDPIAARDELLVRTLRDAVADLTKTFGADPGGWQWGQNAYHHALIRHPLAAVVAAALGARLNVGPSPRGGDSYTVNATGGGDNQTAGGSMKIVADTENWDNAVGLNNPGQSGDPDSPHYRDLFVLWSRGRYFPLAYGRTTVDSVTEARETLTPAVR